MGMPILAITLYPRLVTATVETRDLAGWCRVAQSRMYG